MIAGIAETPHRGGHRCAAVSDRRRRGAPPILRSTPRPPRDRRRHHHCRPSLWPSRNGSAWTSWASPSWSLGSCSPSSLSVSGRPSVGIDDDLARPAGRQPPAAVGTRTDRPSTRTYRPGAMGHPRRRQGHGHPAQRTATTHGSVRPFRRGRVRRAAEPAPRRPSVSGSAARPPRRARTNRHPHPPDHPSDNSTHPDTRVDATRAPSRDMKCATMPTVLVTVPCHDPHAMGGPIQRTTSRSRSRRCSC